MPDGAPMGGAEAPPMPAPKATAPKAAPVRVAPPAPAAEGGGPTASKAEVGTENRAGAEAVKTVAEAFSGDIKAAVSEPGADVDDTLKDVANKSFRDKIADKWGTLKDKVKNVVQGKPVVNESYKPKPEDTVITDPTLINELYRDSDATYLKIRAGKGDKRATDELARRGDPFVPADTSKDAPHDEVKISADAQQAGNEANAFTQEQSNQAIYDKALTDPEAVKKLAENGDKEAQAVLKDMKLSEKIVEGNLSEGGLDMATPEDRRDVVELSAMDDDALQKIAAHQPGTSPARTMYARAILNKRHPQPTQPDAPVNAGEPAATATSDTDKKPFVPKVYDDGSVEAEIIEDETPKSTSQELVPVDPTVVDAEIVEDAKPGADAVPVEQSAGQPVIVTEPAPSTDVEVSKPATTELAKWGVDDKAVEAFVGGDPARAAALKEAVSGAETPEAAQAKVAAEVSTLEQKIKDGTLTEEDKKRLGLLKIIGLILAGIVATAIAVPVAAGVAATAVVAGGVMAGAGGQRG